MKNHLFALLLFFAVTLMLVTSARSAESITPTGFTALFNGADLSGWWGASPENLRNDLALPADELKTKQEASRADIREHWRVENGELANDGKGLYLTTDKVYGNFELCVDYKTAPLADSGIYLRGCPQVQIWDSTDKEKFSVGADKGSSGLWNNSPGAPGKEPLVKADKPCGEWNKLRVIMVGTRVWVWLNDQQTVNGTVIENDFDRKQPVPPRGPIQLQTHGGKISWKSIFIREIGSEESNRILRGADPTGFESVFNGKDFTGWTGATDACRVIDSAIEWLPEKGGVLHTEKEFADFIVRLEFKLPPGSNNGLAIRYPGTGNPAYEAMTECQILDDHFEAATGYKIDPRQAHGSAYGMIPAHRGYHHPIGEWNYQEITVKGSTIKVELNGTQILDADLAKVTEFMDNSPHPGRDRKSGYFGFAGHNDPVMFRNISIKPLD